MNGLYHLREFGDARSGQSPHLHEMRPVLNPLRDTSKKIGQLLVARGWASGDQVLRAIMSQRSLGGRLGTCLLELEVVKEEHLLEILAEQQGSPAAAVSRLRAVPHEVIDLVSPDLAQRCLAVPFAATDRVLDVATPNTRNVALLDEIAFATGRRVRAHVVSEVRIHEALAMYYGVRCPSRYRQLLDRLNRSHGLWAQPRVEEPKLEDLPNVARPVPTSGSYLGDSGVHVAWSAPEETLSISQDGLAQDGLAQDGLAQDGLTQDGPPQNLAFGDVVLDDSMVTAPLAGSQGHELDLEETLRANDEPLGLHDVDQLLGKAGDVEGIGHILASYLDEQFEHSALFRVRQDRLLPWLGGGESFDSPRFQALALHFREPSVFLNLAQGAEFHLGALPPMPAHRKLVECWGGTWPRECLLLPVRLRNRMVVALYGDGGSQPLGGIRIEDWKALTAMAADALELCILRKKLQTD